MRVITFSRHFPKGHPRAGEPTNFVDKVWKCLWDNEASSHNPCYPYFQKFDEIFPNEQNNIHSFHPKSHTIRAGNRWKAGDEFSARVWSGKPYASKQIEFAQIEIKKTFDFLMDSKGYYFINGSNEVDIYEVAQNDGLDKHDFDTWFYQKDNKEFKGQIICWNENVKY